MLFSCGSVRSCDLFGDFFSASVHVHRHGVALDILVQNRPNPVAAKRAPGETFPRGKPSLHRRSF